MNPFLGFQNDLTIIHMSSMRNAEGRRDLECHAIINHTIGNDELALLTYGHVREAR